MPRLLRLCLTVALATLLLVVVAGAPGSQTRAASGPLTSRAVVPALASDASGPAARTYGMGFFAQPPKPSVEAFVAMVGQMARVSDYVMIQREVPWTRIAAGDSFAKIIADDYQGLVDLLRGSGMELVVLVDPLDGLDRTAEAVEATTNHRSLRDAGTGAVHEAWVLALVEALHPAYVGLASEINTMAAQGDHALYEAIRDMCNRLAPRVRQVSPGSRVFVSFQVDNAWQLSPWPKSDVDQFALAREFDVDVVGLSSYPGFSFTSPAEIPDDYFSRFQAASGKPLLMAEGGWGSAGAANNTPANQAAFYQRMFDLLDGVRAELAIFLLYQDLDLSDPGWDLPPERAAVLQWFASMGIAGVNGAAKPAHATWSRRFAAPLVR